MNLKVEVNKLNNVALIRLASNFFTSSAMAKNLKAELDALFSNNQYSVIVNLEEVTSIDSEALGILAYGFKNCRSKNGMFILCNICNQDVKDVLDIVNLSSVIPIFDTEYEALEHINRAHHE